MDDKLLAVLATPLKAQTNSSWNGGRGNWSVESDWNPSGVPNNTGSTTFSVNIVAPNSVVSMDVLNVTIDNLTVAAPNFLTIDAGNTLALVSGTSANYGTISNNGGIGLFGPNSGLSSTLNNYGSISGTGGLRTSPNGTFNNFGTFSGNLNNSFGIVTNQGVLYNSGDSQNNGELDNSGTLFNKGSITNVSSGNITNFANGTLVNSGVLFNEESVENAGTLYNTHGASITNGGLLCFISNTGTIISAGMISNGPGAELSGGTIDNLAGGTLTNSSFLSVSTLNNAGTIKNTFSDAQVDFSAGALFNSGRIENGPKTILSAGITNAGIVKNYGTMNTGNLTNFGLLANGGTINNDGPLTNLGAVRISNAGLLNTNSNYTQFAGSTLVNGTLTANNGAIVNILGGTLCGSGTINGNVVMGGNMIAGTPHNPLTFNINGNYSQNATGIFTELISSKGNGLLNISGTAALAPGALLNIQLVGGYDPKNGTSFAIMDYGSEKGTFTISDPYFNNGAQEWVISSYNGGDGDDVVLTAQASNVVTPEPCTILLVGSALLGMGGYAKKKRASRER